MTVEKLQRGQDILKIGEQALSFVIIYEGQAQLIAHFDCAQTHTGGSLKPIKVLLNQKKDLTLSDKALI